MKKGSRNLFPRSSSLLYLALVYTKTVDSVKGRKLLIALKARSDQLLTVRPSLAIHLLATRAGSAPNNTVIDRE